MKTPDRIEMGKATRYFLDNIEVEEAVYRERHPLPQARSESGATNNGKAMAAANAMSLEPTKNGQPNAVRKI